MSLRLVTRRTLCQLHSKPIVPIARITAPVFHSFKTLPSSARSSRRSTQIRSMASVAPTRTVDIKVDAEHFMHTSGATDAVWTKTFPYSKIPTFPKLKQDLETDVLVIGSGIAGVTIAYELVRQGTKVTMVEARNMLSGETGRTSGHLSADHDEGYVEFVKKQGKEHAKINAQSHQYAIERVGQISKELGIDCEYRLIKAYNISQYPYGTKEHDEDVDTMKEDTDAAAEYGLNATFSEGFAIPGWDGQVDQRDAMIIPKQGAFHPTKYVAGILEWLKKQSNFEAFSSTRVLEINEKGIEVPIIKVHLGRKDVDVKTEDGHVINASHVVQATAVPLQRLSLIAEMEYNRTYCIAIKIPKGVVEDCQIYDSADAYKYVRLTQCDDENDYMIVGGCDHPVGQEDGQDARYDELEKWTRERFTKAGSVDFKWSGQIFESMDFAAFIGRNSGSNHVYVVTGDYGNGLTHGTIAGKLISDMILGIENPWESLYDPRRRGIAMAKSIPAVLKHDVEANAQYKRFAQTDITDLEDLGLEQGGVLNTKTSKAPVAVYKDGEGKVHRMSALCPHMKGVLCWNNSEKSWDCPVHGSRFSKDGKQLCGPANANMHPEEQNELKTGFQQ